MEKTIEQPCPTDKTKQREKPCAHMLHDEGGTCNRRCGECKRAACISDNVPTCALLSADDRTASCPFADDDGNAKREDCKFCPLPAYHESDPVTRLLDFGFREHLDNLRDVTGGCVEGECFTETDCVFHSGPRMAMCPTVPSRLRIMYLGAEWRRRNSR